MTTENPDEMADFGHRALAAWEQGEHSGDYGPFRALLGDVRLFSHPMLGRHDGPAAAEQLTRVMEERRAKPNALTFSNLVVTSGPGVVVCLFDSEGEISGDTPYSGYNAIAFLAEHGRVVGFREYFGSISV